MAGEAIGAFKDPTKLFQWTTRLLYLQLAVTGIALISGFLEYQLLIDLRDGAFASEAESTEAAEASDARQAIVGVAQFFLFFVLGITALRWIYRANYNARQLGAYNMRTTPGWSVGWYFVPIASLWKPCQSMAEIWRASVNPLDWRLEPIPAVLGLWWFFWISHNVLAQVALRMSLRADDLPEITMANVVSNLSDGFEIPLTVTFLVLVKRIHQMQMSHFTRHTLIDALQ